MPGLDLRLFGPMEVRVNGQPLPHLRSRKGLWLLAILALRAGRDVDRVWLAGTLWPDADESHALRSLRQTLHDLRLALGSEAFRLASEEPRTLRLDIDQASVDTLAFDAAIAQGDTSSLESAVQIYKGPLLEGCAEDWSMDGRRQREEDYLRAVEELADQAIKRAEHAAAARYLRLAVAVDPFREDLQRKLMEALAVDSPAGALLVYRQFRALVGREMMTEPAEETTTLFRRIRDETRAHAKKQESNVGQTVSASPPPRTLPLQLTQLIGRDKEVGEVIQRLSQSRLVTLTGAGGIGKTRLAIQVAEELSGQFSDGAYFVDLAPLENSDLLPHAVRAAIGQPEQGIHDPVDALCRVISTSQMMLILDNCEHLGEACGSLSQTLLSRCSGVKILATSRQVLGLKGETVWRVPSLIVPTIGSRRVSVADIRPVATYLDYSAIRLFSERARAAEASFQPTRRNSIAIVKICSLLDGIPLAIELAAARVKVMSVEKIAERLADRFKLLLRDSRSRDSAPVARQATLRASIDWSYDLLSDHEQIVLRRLAVFSGGWTLEAAEAVCAADPIEEWEVLDLLTGLVEKSLVTYQPEDERYRMLETIRQYMADRMEEEGSGDSIARRHLEFFMELAEAAEPELTGPKQAAWLDRLESEQDNLRTAMSFSLDCSPLPELGERLGVRPAGLRLAGALGRFWQMRGYYNEGRSWLGLILAASSLPTSSQSRALDAAATLASRQGDYAAAARLFENSLEIRRGLGDRPGMAFPLNGLAVVTMIRGDNETARSLYEECLSISRSVGNRFVTANCLHNLGSLAYNSGDLSGSRSFHEEALAIRREMGDRSSIALSLACLGGVSFDQGDLVSSRALHEESLAIRREIGDRPSIAYSLYFLGGVAMEEGDYHSAALLLGESLELRRDMGDRANTDNSLTAIAELLCRGRRDGYRAAQLYGAAEALRQSIGAPLIAFWTEAYERNLNEVRKLLDPETFDAAWAEGRRMTPEQAVEYALSLTVIPNVEAVETT